MNRPQVTPRTGFQPFDVYLLGEWIDRKFYNRSLGYTVHDVQRDLIERDNFNPMIEVRSQGHTTEN